MTASYPLRVRAAGLGEPAGGITLGCWIFGGESDVTHLEVIIPKGTGNLVGPVCRHERHGK